MATKPPTRNQGNSNVNVRRPEKPKAGPIESYITQGGKAPKLNHLGNVRNCPGCNN